MKINPFKVMRWGARNVAIIGLLCLVITMTSLVTGNYALWGIMFLVWALGTAFTFGGICCFKYCLVAPTKKTGQNKSQ